MKNSALAFASIGSLIIIAFFFIVNFTTSFAHPWFIYPTFLVMWWPMALALGGIKGGRAFSIAGSLWTSAFFIAVNLITSPGYLWFIYPVFLVLFWPMSLFICGVKKYKLFSVVVSLYVTLFFFLVNFISTTNVIWFIYPAFAILWWPISQIICGARRYKLYSIIASVYFIAFLALVNYLTSPGYIWFYYPAFAIIWWPLSMFLAKKKYIRQYSIVMSLVMLGFFAIINLQNSPSFLWFHFIIFYLAWWPIVIFLGRRAKSLAFSIVGAIAIIVYHIGVYYLQTPPMHPWYLYMILPAIWWPVCIGLKDRAKSRGFSLFSTAIFTVYYGVLNLIFYSDYLWVVYILYLAAWVFMGHYFGRKKKFFALSIFGALITIILFAYINYVSTPNHIWAIYPSFAVLWWPLSMYFFKVRNRKT